MRGKGCQWRDGIKDVCDVPCRGDEWISKSGGYRGGRERQMEQRHGSGHWGGVTLMQSHTESLQCMGSKSPEAHKGSLH